MASDISPPEARASGNSAPATLARATMVSSLNRLNAQNMPVAIQIAAFNSNLSHDNVRGGITRIPRRELGSEMASRTKNQAIASQGAARKAPTRVWILVYLDDGKKGKSPRKPYERISASTR